MRSRAQAEGAPWPPGASPWVDARRLLDIAVALCGLLLCAPALAAIAVAVWIESGRPIFFSQIRLGHGGRHFRLHKFRKFGPAAPAAGSAVTVRADPRMTRVGAFLERTKLDELPQIFNLLKGDMTLVGPRPESLAFQDCFRGRFQSLLDHKPGLFGPCQALFRNESHMYPDGLDPEQFYRDALFPMKAHLDLLYFASRTMATDVSWVLRGIFAVLGRMPSPDCAPPAPADMEALVAGTKKSRGP